MQKHEGEKRIDAKVDKKKNEGLYLSQLRRRISDIRIAPRARKDLGNMDWLVNSIRELGIIQPIVIDRKNNLKTGYRRLKACEILGWEEVPVTFNESKDALRVELDENTVRKDFTFSERMELLEEIEKSHSKLESKNKGKTKASIVAKATGTSESQIYKEKSLYQTIKDNPKFQPLLKEIDSGELSIHNALKIVKGEPKKQNTLSLEYESPADKLQNEIASLYKLIVREYELLFKDFEVFKESINEYNYISHDNKIAAELITQYFLRLTQLQYSLMHIAQAKRPQKQRQTNEEEEGSMIESQRMDAKQIEIDVKQQLEQWRQYVPWFNKALDSDPQLAKQIVGYGKENDPLFEKKVLRDILRLRVIYLRAYRMLLSPYSDRKWQRDWLQWCDIIDNRYEHTSAYAASKSKVNIARIVNKKTGKPEQRAITKEHIDNQCVFLLRKMFFIINTMMYMDFIAYGPPENISIPAFTHRVDLEKSLEGSDLVVVEELEIPDKELTKPRMYKKILKYMKDIIKGDSFLYALHKNFMEIELGYSALRQYELGPKLSESA